MYNDHPLFRKLSFVTILLGNSKGPVELNNPNICAEVKLCLFLFTSALEIVCHKTEVFETVNSSYVRMNSLENLSLQ